MLIQASGSASQPLALRLPLTPTVPTRCVHRAHHARWSRRSPFTAFLVCIPCACRSAHRTRPRDTLLGWRSFIYLFYLSFGRLQSPKPSALYPLPFLYNNRPKYISSKEKRSRPQINYRIKTNPNQRSFSVDTLAVLPIFFCFLSFFLGH